MHRTGILYAQSAKKIAEREIKNRPDWFSCSEAKLLHHIGIWNEAFKKHFKKRNQTSLNAQRRARANLQRVKWQAKRNWQCYYTDQSNTQDFKQNPKATWDIAFKIMEGFMGHFKTYNPKAKNGRNKTATKPKENADILEKHFQIVFNQKTQIDPTVFKNLEQNPIANDLSGPPTIDKSWNAITKMKNNKSPGFLGWQQTC